MELYLIRHAHAVDREDWQENDLLRPLTAKGVKRAHTAFARFCALFPLPNHIISSTAVRSVQTAEILNAYAQTEISTTALLNPGAGTVQFKQVLDARPMNSTLAIIGHEPDLSQFAAQFICGEDLMLELKKGSIIHIKDGILMNLLQQKVLL